MSKKIKSAQSSKERIKQRWGKIPIWLKVVFFLLFPWMVASILSGHSLMEMWEKRSSEKANFKRHFVRNVLVWTAATLWLFGFWSIIFPWILIYLT
jgi:hypothetical protein